MFPPAWAGSCCRSFGIYRSRAWRTRYARRAPRWRSRGRAASQVFGLKSGLSRDFRQDGWAEFFRIVKREWVLRPSVLLHDLVGAHRAVVTPPDPDRKSTRLNSSHLGISYAVF